MDPQTVSVIATTAVGILSSYFAKAGKVAVKKIGEDIYHTLKAHLEKKPVAEEALTDLENTPSDTDLQAALRVQLKKLLAEDEPFASSRMIHTTLRIPASLAKWLRYYHYCREANCITYDWGLKI